MPRPDQRNKGVRQYQLIVNYFLTLDKSRGYSYRQLAKMYRLDESNIRKRILGILNEKANKARKRQRIN